MNTAKGKFSGWHLFVQAMRKNGVSDISEIRRNWWSLSKNERIALNNQVNCDESTWRLSTDQCSFEKCTDGKYRYVCVFCGSKYQKRFHMKSHLGCCRLGNPSNSACEFCGKQLASLYSLKRHLHSCKQAKTGCKLDSSSDSIVVHHLEEKFGHLVENETFSAKKFSCSVCHRVFSQRTQTLKHVADCVRKGSSSSDLFGENYNSEKIVGHDFENDMDDTDSVSTKREREKQDNSEDIHEVSLDFDSLIQFPLNEDNLSFFDSSPHFSTQLRSSDTLSVDHVYTQPAIKTQRNFSRNVEGVPMKLYRSKLQNDLKCQLCIFSKRTAFSNRQDWKSHMRDVHKVHVSERSATASVVTVPRIAKMGK